MEEREVAGSSNLPQSTYIYFLVELKYLGSIRGLFHTTDDYNIGESCLLNWPVHLQLDKRKLGSKNYLFISNELSHP